MLSPRELSKIYVFNESLPDESYVKGLIDTLLFEYTQYIECGTIEECKSRKEWMDYSLNDIMGNFNAMVKGLREEVDNIKKEAELKRKPRR